MHRSIEPGALSRRALLAFAGSAALVCASRPGFGQDRSPLLQLRAEMAELRVDPEREPLGAPAFSGAPPVLRARRGERIVIEVENALDRPFSLHWHGVRGPDTADGAARLTEEPIAPGEKRLVATTPPDTGTFLYRADVADPGELAALGTLAGVLVVEDDAPPVADRDLVLALQSHAAPWYAPETPPRRLATINGQTETTIAARPLERLRLRVANAALTVPAALVFHGLDLRVAAIDGQPCPTFPLFQDRVVLPPAGRIDLVAEMPPPGAQPPLILDELDDMRPLARFLLSDAPAAAAARPRELPPNGSLPRAIPLERAIRATLALAGPSAGRAGPPLFKAQRGRTVSLAIENKTQALFAVHWHGHAARLLDAMDDGWKPWWHDTVLVRPAETQRVVFVASSPGKWALDGLPVGGEAAPVATWFQVT